ncbi:hypothetical protein PVAP13_6KG413520 [Panicum virgatum]|uniref:Uncharacterized protein n=1 Tax=Panicum virgatum TaxID=38727 RepID=A0A8T0RI50_PANVG|nr:hypothetical protein PVAP13_6KG413520 [Panicum virgatum]
MSQCNIGTICSLQNESNDPRHLRFHLHTLFSSRLQPYERAAVRHRYALVDAHDELADSLASAGAAPRSTSSSRPVRRRSSLPPRRHTPRRTSTSRRPPTPSSVPRPPRRPTAAKTTTRTRTRTRSRTSIPGTPPATATRPARRPPLPLCSRRPGGRGGGGGGGGGEPASTRAAAARFGLPTHDDEPASQLRRSALASTARDSASAAAATPRRAGDLCVRADGAGLQRERGDAAHLAEADLSLEVLAERGAGRRRASTKERARSSATHESAAATETTVAKTEQHTRKSPSRHTGASEPIRPRGPGSSGGAWP